MYKLAKIDRRANSSFKKKNIYIYYLIYIYIFIYKYSPGRARVCSFFFWRTLYIFLFHSLARSVFDWLRFQSGSLWDSSFSNFCLWYIRCLDTTRTLISLHHLVSLFFFYILSYQRRNENLRAILVLSLFRQVLRLIWQWFVADSTLLLLGQEISEETF